MPFHFQPAVCVRGSCSAALLTLRGMVRLFPASLPHVCVVAVICISPKTNDVELLCVCAFLPSPYLLVRCPHLLPVFKIEFLSRTVKGLRFYHVCELSFTDAA